MNDETLESVVQMAEAHLLNVQNEIKKLEEAKADIEKKIIDYNEYLTRSINDVRIVREDNKPINTPMPEMPE